MGCGLSKAHYCPEVLVSHRNARTTSRGRQLIVEGFAQGWPKAHIAAAMGISRKCVGTWFARHAAEGEARLGLHDRSSRPHRMPTHTPDAFEDQIVTLRRAQRCGPEVIGAELGVAARTVSRVLRRRDVFYLRDCDPMTGELIRASKTTAMRYETTPGRVADLHGQPEGGQRRDTADAAQSVHHRGELAVSGQLRDRLIKTIASIPAGQCRFERSLVAQLQGRVLEPLGT